jgi:hypothetical protein
MNCNFDNLQIGDKVAFYSYSNLTLLTVERVTKTRVRAKGMDFNKKNGYRIGDAKSYRPAYICNYDESVVAQIERQNDEKRRSVLTRQIAETHFKSLTTEQLETLAQQLDEWQAANKQAEFEKEHRELIVGANRRFSNRPDGDAKNFVAAYADTALGYLSETYSSGFLAKEPAIYAAHIALQYLLVDEESDDYVIAAIANAAVRSAQPIN